MQGAACRVKEKCVRVCVRVGRSACGAACVHLCSAVRACVNACLFGAPNTPLSVCLKHSFRVQHVHNF